MGKCLTCGRIISTHPDAKDKNKCCKCWRKQRLRKKANKRGKPKNYYLEGQNK